MPAGELIMSSLSERDKPASKPPWKAGDGSLGAVAFHHGELAEVPGPLPTWQLKSGAPDLPTGEPTGSLAFVAPSCSVTSSWNRRDVCICQRRGQVEKWGEERKVSLTAPMSN